jgi:hypothetical protein
MEDENVRTHADIPSDSPRSLMGISPDEILRKIDLLKREGSYIPPKVLDWLVNPPAGKYDEQSGQAIRETTAVNQRLIDDIFDSIQAYVDSHEEDLIGRSPREPEFVTGTFAQLHSQLNAVSESVTESLFKVFGDTAERIRKIPVLTDDQKQERIRAAYDRARQENREIYATFSAMLDKVTDQFRNIVEEIETR